VGKRQEGGSQDATLTVEGLLDQLKRDPKALPAGPYRPEESLFSTNSQFGRVTGRRRRRKGDKTLRNSHGGPVGGDRGKEEEVCGAEQDGHPGDLAILDTELGACRDQVSRGCKFM
jgi:hypothetical protein